MAKPVKAEKKPAKKPVPAKSAAKPEPAVEAKKGKESAKAAIAAAKEAAAKGKNLPEGDTSGDVKLEVNRSERNARINELVKLAREQGYVTYDDINEAVPESVVSPEEFEGILILLKGMDIEVTENPPDEAKEAEKEEKPRPGAKVDVLDDPVRMYLKQMGQVPLLTREQEVEISMRIEEAEINARHLFSRFGFSTGAFLALVQRLEEGKERFDRIVSDKHVDSRERYMKNLIKLRKAIEKEHDGMAKKFAAMHKGQMAKVMRDRRRKQFDQSRAKLADILDELCFKQKAIEDFVTTADDRYHQLRQYRTSLAKAESSKAKNAADLAKEAKKNILQFELDECMAAEDFEKQYLELKMWLRKGLRAKTEMVEANLRLVISIAKK